MINIYDFLSDDLNIMEYKYAVDLEKERTIKTRFKKKKKDKNKCFYKSKKWVNVRYEALLKHGKKCQLCGATPPNVILHVDHIKPRSKHPELELELDNLQILCKQCNLGKSNKDETDFR